MVFLLTLEKLPDVYQFEYVTSLLGCGMLIPLAHSLMRGLVGITCRYPDAVMTREEVVQVLLCRSDFNATGVHGLRLDRVPCVVAAEAAEAARLQASREKRV